MTPSILSGEAAFGLRYEFGSAIRAAANRNHMRTPLTMGVFFMMPCRGVGIGWGFRSGANFGEEFGAFEGAEGAVVFVFDLGAVAEEVFVEEIVGVVVGSFEHAEGEAFEGVGGGFGVLGEAEAFGELGLIKGVEPGGFGVGEALDEPLLLGEALDEEGFGGALRGKVGEERGFEGVVFGLVLEGKNGELGGEAVLEGVETGGLFAGVGFGAGGLLGIAPVGGALFFGGHEFLQIQGDIGGQEF